jgi:LuxR family maltose regulon positive regulatory protein
MTGNNSRATQILKAARQDYINTSNLYLARIAIAYLEGIYLSELRLREAERECREAFELDARFLPGTTDLNLTPRTDYCGLYVRLGIVNYLRTELEEAEANIKLGIELARSEKNNLILVAGLLWQARVYLVKKNVETEKAAIRQLVTEAEGIINTSGLTWLWSVHSMPVFLSDLYFRLGEEDKARYWSASFKSAGDAATGSRENNKPTAEPDLSIVTELETIATAWRLLGEDKAEEALDLTGRLEQVATQTGRLKGLLEVLVLRAASLNKLGQTVEAIENLQEALQLAAPERVSYIFLERYRDLALLLPTALNSSQARTFAPEFLHRLVSAGKNEAVTESGGLNLPEVGSKINPAQNKVENIPVKPQPPKGNASLVEPLSDRELEVLELIAQGVANQEISERLIIAMPTVKKHIGNIFAKLEVTNRVQALLRARELGLIA